MGERTSLLRFLAHDAASGPIKQINHAVNGLHKDAGKLDSVFQGIGVGVGLAAFQAIGGAIQGIASGIAGLVSGSLAKAGEMERFSVQLETLLGSAEAADARLRDLVEFAAKTPFELPGVIAASRTLQVFTQGALATGAGLTLVGDIAAGTGQEFQGVAMWVGRLYDAMKSGRPFGEAAMRLQEMGALSGDARNRIEALAKGVKSGAISMADAWKIATKEFAQFSGLMDKQSRTLEGLMSNLSDQVGQSLAGIGKELLPIAKAVLPVIMGMVKDAGNAVARFIHDNYIMIRNWVVGIVSFIGGLVSAIFGQTSAVKGLTTAVAGNTKVTDENTDAQDNHTGSSGANTAALEKQIKKVDALTDAVKQLDDAQDKQFRKELERLTGAVDLQIDAIDLADKLRGIAEQRADQLRNIADAEADIQKIMADGGDAASAIQRLSDIRAAAAEFELDQADNARKGELEAVKAFIDQIADAEGEWASKKGFLEHLKAQEAILQSDLATANAAGNLQKVADLTLQLEAIKLAEIRAKQAIANEDQTREFDKQKARLTKLKEAASATAGGMAADFLGAGNDITDVFGGVETDLVGNISKISGAFGGRSERDGPGGGEDTSLIGVMGNARRAGIKFAETMIEWLRKVSDAVGTLMGFLQGLASFIGTVSGAVQTLIDATRFLDPWQWGKLLNPMGPPPGVTGKKGLAGGGPVSPGGTYLVGERGPELLHMGGQAGTIIPNGGNMAPVVIQLQVDGRTLAEIVDQRLGYRYTQAARTSGVV